MLLHSGFKGFFKLFFLMVITFLEGGQLDDLGVDLGPSNFALAANDGRWSTPCFCTVVRRGSNFEISTLLSVLRNSVLS